MRNKAGTRKVINSARSKHKAVLCLEELRDSGQA